MLSSDKGSRSPAIIFIGGNCSKNLLFKKKKKKKKVKMIRIFVNRITTSCDNVNKKELS